MKWSEKYDIRFHDTNSNEILGISHIFKLLQETAMKQMRACKPSYTDLLNENKALILSAMRVECYSPVSAFEAVEVKSWACPSRGFTTTRSFAMYRDEELICEANSVWALVSVSDKRLLRVTEMDFTNFEPEEPLTLEKGVKVHIPKEMKLSLVGEYTVRYTDTDLNGHVNNTNYPDIFFNALPNPQDKWVKSIAISYQNDAKMGDHLKIYMGLLDGKYLFRSVHDDGRTNVEIEMEIESLE